MPYIERDSRKYWDDRMAPLLDSIDDSMDCGKMNYLITKIMIKWVNKRLKYMKVCLVMGTLICVAFEFYRRVAAPYEDSKIEQNGDVY